MSEYINKEELMAKFDPGKEYNYHSIWRKVETTRVLRSVVLCRNCQFARNDVTGDPDEWFCERSWRGRVKVEADDFCKWGEPV